MCVTVYCIVLKTGGEVPFTEADPGGGAKGAIDPPPFQHLVTLFCVAVVGHKQCKKIIVAYTLHVNIH